MEVTFDTTIGGDSSTSYVDLDYCKQYLFDAGYTDAGTIPDSDLKRALNKATRWIDSNYRTYYTGIRQYDDQLLEWPRSSSYYPLDNYYISEDTIPIEIKYATCEVAHLINSGEDISATISKDGKIAEYEVKVDVIEERTVYESALYSNVYVIVDEALSRLVGDGASQFQVTAMRSGGESP